MKQRVYILINGILTRSTDHQDWPERAEDWIQAHGYGLGRPYMYFTGALTRLFYQWKRVKDVIKIMESYAGAFDIILVGHSNGADIICRVLQQSRIHVSEVHLIAGACENQCSKNGINAAIKKGRLDCAFFYCSKNDDALKFAQRSHWLLRFGDLGLTGPSKLSTLADSRSVIYWRDDLNHCDWWNEKNFESTIRIIVGSSVKEKAA